MSSGGGDSQTIGYRYYLGAQLALCHGPIDSISELIVGERSAWAGSVAYVPGTVAEIGVSAEELFGGEEREGGVSGLVRVNFGDVTTQDPYLVSKLGAHVPAYVGLVTALFRGPYPASGSALLGRIPAGAPSGFYWSALNPYFKAPWLRIRRVTKGWARDTVWYAAKAAVGSLDMNPAHIVYEALTNTKWGMGYTPGDIDDASFTAAADVLYAEGFGMSLIWDQQISINDFVQVILNHINGTLRLDLTTGKFTLKLVRDDYTIGALLALNPSNVIELTSFQRAAWGDTANEVVVKYTNREQVEATVTVQDLANIEVQGAIVSTTKEYLGVRDADLAQRLAIRDLNVLCTPLATVTLVANRVMWDKEVGDLFALTWPELGISNAAFRIMTIDKGSITDGKIQVQAVEDVFGMPDSSYTGEQDGEWVDPVQPPQPVLEQLAVEAPYWEVVKNVPEAAIQLFPSGYGFGELMATRSGSSDFNFAIWDSPIPSGFTDSGSRGTFTASGRLATSIGEADTNIVLAGAHDLELLTAGAYCYIGTECVSVTAVDLSIPSITCIRAVLDTVPAAHAVNTLVMFAPGGADKTERVAGESVYYRLLPRNGRGTLSLPSATTLGPLVLNYRAERPLPPGNININSVYRPALVQGPLTLIAWANRNRLTQTVTFVPQTAGNITPEVGQTTTVTITKKLLQSDVSWTAAETATGLTGTSYIPTLANVDNACWIRTEIKSVRDGLDSWQTQVVETELYGFGINFGNYFGGAP
jgi:hypothetical protein